jgi:hypothetical protein
MTTLREITISAGEVVKGIIMTAPVIGVLMAVSWNLSSQLTALREQNRQMREEMGKIEQYLKMPDAAIPPQSYTLPEDPSVSKSRNPSLPQLSVVPQE